VTSIIQSNFLRHIWQAAAVLVCATGGALPASAAGFGGSDEPPAPVKRTLLGSMTFSFYDQGALASHPSESEEVRYAMTEALNIYNTVARYSGNVPVSYVTLGGVTAQATAGGSIQFGYIRSPRSALHEMAHWMGLTPGNSSGKAVFGALCNNGWQGATGKARMNAFVPGAGIGCENVSAHFWDYGLNYDGEYHWLSMGRNVAMVGAMRADLGLSDGSTLPDQAFRLVNRASGKMLADKSSVEAGDVIDAVSTVSNKQLWTVSFNGGLIRLRNVQTNRYLDGSGSMPVLRASPTSADGTWWEMTPTTEGHFRLRNKASNLCLKSVGSVTPGASMQLADCQGYWNPDAGLQFSLATKTRPPGLPEVDTVVQLAPTNYPRMRVGVDADAREVIRTMADRPTAGSLMQGGSAYVVRRGLADDQCISLEAYNRPGSYLRHAYFIGWLNNNDGSDLFKADATFCPTNGMDDPGAVTLQSLNYPDRVLRHAYFQMRLDPAASRGNIEADASFAITPVWNARPNGGPAGSIIASQSGRCMDAPVPASGTPFRQTLVWQCNGNAVQKWRLTAAMELRNQYDGKCLDAAYGGTAAGTALIAWACHGGPNQRWTVQLDGSIKNPQSGLCVDGRGQANGEGLTLQACGGQASQKWRFE
jgi:Alpha-L-arabinofuranosidase B (ABFB) domain/Ricin-type beta-trefoil lectin domain/Ricin-type beta-trefoil lectin domain-like